MPKKLFSFRFDEVKLIKPLTKRAHEENRSLTNLIETILLEYLKKK